MPATLAPTRCWCATRATQASPPIIHAAPAPTRTYAMLVCDEGDASAPPIIHAAPAPTRTYAMLVCDEGDASVPTHHPRRSRPYANLRDAGVRRGRRKRPHPSSTPLPPLREPGMRVSRFLLEPPDLCPPLLSIYE